MSDLQWQPIALAPKDGSWIIVYRESVNDVIRVRYGFGYEWSDEQTAYCGTIEDDDLFIPCPDFPKAKVMIEGNELLEWLGNNAHRLNCEIAAHVCEMISEAQGGEWRLNQNTEAMNI